MDVAALKRECRQNMQRFILKLANQDRKTQEQFGTFGEIPNDVLRQLAKGQFARGSTFDNIQPAVTREYRDLIFATLTDRAEARQHAGRLMQGLNPR